MQTEPFTVVLTIRNGNSIEQSTHVIDAPCEKVAVQAAWNYASQDYPNARAANELVLMGQVVFAGAHSPLNAYNEAPFDFEGNAPNVPEEEQDLYRAVVSGNNADELAIMSCWFDREPTWALVSVNETEGEEILVSPLYVRLTEALRQRLRAADGEPLEYEEEEGAESPDPSLH